MVKNNNPHSRDWRNKAWSLLTEGYPERSREWDIIVIGGGITGAGILREAARRGLSAALIEQRDFAWGASSRSSQLVHGGLRYLQAGQVKLTRDLLRERERLLRQAPGLVDPVGFLFSDYKGRGPERRLLGLLLSVYDLLARQWNHRYYPPHEYTLLAPRIGLAGLKGGTQYFDAITDDARLVFRVIGEAEKDGALALNYVSAEELLMNAGQVCGAALRDGVSGATAEVRAKVVVNATGAWGDRLRKEVGGSGQIRPLRGSHLLFPFWRIPVAQTIAFTHPVDRRYVFLLPWEGATLVGNTDLDHDEGLNAEACITPREVDYLLDAVRFKFPGLRIEENDILSTYAGVRPVIGTGAKDPSKEKRDHGIWIERGLISVSGGKLTNFRLMALDVLRRGAQFLPSLAVEDRGEAIFRQASRKGLLLQGLDYKLRRRLEGRYGPEAGEVAKCAKEGELKRVPETDMLWAELRWGARTEAVVHLEDLLLRRTRLGLLVREGGVAFFDRFRVICQEELGWDNGRWQEEADAFKKLHQRSYTLPQAKV
jgi:glycerol-3-phosphate dehydrogenase